MKDVTGRIGLALAVLAATAVPAFGNMVEIVDPNTGEIIRYRPSFAKEAAPERPTYRYFDPSTGGYATYQASREEMAERHRMKYARAHVRFVSGEPAGTIVVDTLSRYLYHLNADGTATRYGIGVGREGFTWTGIETVSRKREWPDWTPPAEMLERRSDIPEYMPGGPNNPLGARALYLGSTLYRIHGTNEDESIGYAVSSGCIRMLNEDVVDLYNRTKIGTRVIVLGPQADRSGLLAAISGF